jgi:cytochrome c peroxidase
MFLKILLFTPFIFIAYLSGEEMIRPIPLTIDYDDNKSRLGKLLFSDPTLSRDGSISCESCHNLKYNGADNTPVSFGVNRVEGELNSPTVFNAIFNFRQFWNGRARDLKEQVDFPVTSHIEMNLTVDEVVERVESSNIYRKMFHQIYGEVTFENIADAISEFEKTLITPNSKFDQYLRGGIKLSKEERDGYLLFKSKGCISCHHGINVGGNMYQKFGAMIERNMSELGRYTITKRESERHFVKVPSLRNVTITAPYFHDGSEYELKQAIYLMAYHQLGIAIKEDEVDSIAIFLETLRGELPITIRGNDD